MKKVSSLKKKLAAFGLAVCTFVTSLSVKECAAVSNTAQQNQTQQEGWTACEVIKTTVKLMAAVGFGIAAYSYPEYAKSVVVNIFKALLFAIKHYKISGGIALATIIGIMINKLKNFPKTLTDGINDAKAKRKKLEEEEKKLKEEEKKLEEEMRKLKEKQAKINTESCRAFGEELIATPKKVITAGATVASGAWTCATIGVKVAALGAKGVFYGAKGLWNLLDWIENGCVPFWHKYF